MKEMERVRWAVNAIFLTIDQPGGLELFRLEVWKPLPCLLCVCCVLMCEPIDLYCTCRVALCVGQPPDRGRVGWEQSLEGEENKRWERR